VYMYIYIYILCILLQIIIMFNSNRVSAVGEKTYEETGEAVVSHTLILHPLCMERKIIPKKAKCSVAVFILWRS